MTFSQFHPPWLSPVSLSVNCRESLGSSPSSVAYQLDRSPSLSLSVRVMATQVIAGNYLQSRFVFPQVGPGLPPGWQVPRQRLLCHCVLYPQEEDCPSSRGPARPVGTPPSPWANHKAGDVGSHEGISPASQARPGLKPTDPSLRKRPEEPGVGGASMGRGRLL